MKINTSKVEYGSYPNNEWIVDFANGGNVAPESNLDTIVQAVRFALETGRFQYPIMGSNFGTVFDDLIGTDYAYVRSEISRRITEALLIDDRIVGVRDFQYTQGDNSAITVSCTVETMLGDVNISTTIGG